MNRPSGAQPTTTMTSKPFDVVGDIFPESHRFHMCRRELQLSFRQRWSIENEWHWARDAQLGEDAHRYANRTGAAVFSLLRTIAMNLLRLGGHRSIRHGLRELAYDIQGMLALGGVTSAGATTGSSL